LIIDERIESSCVVLGDWPLSRVYLKNESSYPWFILVPRKDNIHEIYQLTKEERIVLIEEVNLLSVLVKNYFMPDKLNIGALGNVVPQLHVHIIGRTKTDSLWPQGIWQSSMRENPYKSNELETLTKIFKPLIEDSLSKLPTFYAK